MTCVLRAAGVDAHWILTDSHPAENRPVWQLTESFEMPPLRNDDSEDGQSIEDPEESEYCPESNPEDDFKAAPRVCRFELNL